MPSTGAASDGSASQKDEAGWFSATIAATLSVIMSALPSEGSSGPVVRTAEPSVRPNFCAVCCVTATLIVGKNPAIRLDAANAGAERLPASTRT
jgi:hypothetical protein